MDYKTIVGRIRLKLGFLRGIRVPLMKFQKWITPYWVAPLLGLHPIPKFVADWDEFAKLPGVKLHTLAPKSERGMAHLPDTLPLPQYAVDQIQGEVFGVFTLEISNGRLWGGQACTIISEGGVVHGPMSRELYDPEYNEIFRRVGISNPKYYDGKVVRLASRWSSSNFYHFLLDVIPQVWCLIESGFSINDIDLFVVSGQNFKWQRNLLSTVGVPLDRVQWIDGKVNLEAKILLCPYVKDPINPPPYWVIKKFSDFAKSYQSKSKKYRLYIERKGSRKIKNSDEIFSTLSKYGFIRFCPGNFSIEEQIDKFANAEMVIGPHGADLSNTVFCDQATTLIEIFNGKYFDASFIRISLQKYMNYDFLNIPKAEETDRLMHRLSDFEISAVEVEAMARKHLGLSQ